ncbi:uncharacterized protein EDB93DRAFT_827153 [Suillus bovinus]|uniref:uncharacterized protein n=1 Tax=Suillus bovinus TaxID=48563 RepID=UPI001B86E42E|nr:uncharacterized protein EDB93DRAFT_827153 [Suillus bovinus]KAG2135387.1 hypothetical protein EDB93DRAFT_827153 [Suillus bovinus]
MKSFTSPKASSRPVLRITIPTVKDTAPWHTMTLVLQSSRPSAFSWRRLLRPSRRNKSFRDGETHLTEDLTSPSDTLVESPIEEKLTSPKMVRFDDSPTYIRTRRRIKPHKSPTPKGSLRSCLVINNTDPLKEVLSDDDDEVSVYEDCLTYYPGFFKDMEDLLEREHLKQMEIAKSRSPSWDLTEFGCTKMDPQEYLSSCLAKQAEKKSRQDIEGWRKVVYDHPMTLRWPSREITERPVQEPSFIPITPPQLFVPEPTPVTLNWHQQIVCDVTDMLISLCIGLTIHMCIYILGIYCFFSGVFLDEE